MTYRRNSEVVKRDIAGEVFLVPVKNNIADMRNVYVLHGTGEFVWDRLDGQAETQQLASEIAREYDVDEKTALGDLEEYLSDLASAGLVCGAGGA